MIVRRSTELRINTGNYESVTLRAEIELNRDEFPEEVSLLGTIQAILDESLDKDVNEVREVSGNVDSFIHHWKVQEIA